MKIERRIQAPISLTAIEGVHSAMSAAEDLLRYTTAQIDVEAQRVVDALDERQVTEVLTWARACTTSNCGWAEYGAAQKILALVRGDA